MKLDDYCSAKHQDVIVESLGKGDKQMQKTAKRPNSF